MSTKKKMRDFQRCLRNLQSFSDSQAKIHEWDDTQLDWVEILIRPHGGHYQGGSFTFKVFLEKDYPQSAPRVDCLTPIYHPNIDPTCDDSNVCLNLFDEWDEKFGLEDVIQGLLFLFYNPNIDDPLSPYFDVDMDVVEMEENIKQSLLGGCIDDSTEDFPENVDAEVFDGNELNKSIELILEKACKMIVKEEEEENVKQQEQKDDEEDVENNNNTYFVFETDPCSVDHLIMRVDSKIERTDHSGALCDTNCDSAEYVSVTNGPSLSTDTPRGRHLYRYIPQTFITTQPDFFVTAFMTCLDLAVR